MRLVELSVGFLVCLFSILGYQYSSSLVETVQHTVGYFVTVFFPNINHQNPQGYPLQMSPASVDTMKKVVKVGFIATAIIGVGCAFYGVIAKKPSHNVYFTTDA